VRGDPGAVKARGRRPAVLTAAAQGTRRPKKQAFRATASTWRACSGEACAPSGSAGGSISRSLRPPPRSSHAPHDIERRAILHRAAFLAWAAGAR
jgi:hypothetical protein